MLVNYCDTCGVRIPAEDLSNGAGFEDSEHRAFCAKCAPAARAAFKATQRTGSYSRGTRQIRDPKRRKLNPLIPIGGVVGSVGLLVLMLLVGGKNEQPTDTTKAPPVAPVSDPTPSPAPKTITNDPKPPDPPTKKAELDDFREGFAKRTWDDLKGRFERAGPGDYNIRKQIGDLSTNYKNTEAGREAGEYLKNLASSDPPPPKPGSIVAGYGRDYKQPVPATGWRYLWNTGAIGTSKEYASLVYNPSRGGYTGQTDAYPAHGPAGWALIAQDGGHPGPGVEQKNVAADHFAIASYTLQRGQSGKMAVSGKAGRNEKASGGTIDLRIFVNDTLKLTRVLDGAGSPFEFAIALDVLKEGDTLFVCVGPDKADAEDQFYLDFTLYKLP